jgi:hypothetical protein
MSVRTWKLTDSAGGAGVEQLEIGPDDVGGAVRDFSIVKKTLRGGPSDGVETVRLDNGRFACVVLPTRGMGIWKGWLGKTELGWKSPNRGPVHPQFVDLGEPGGLGWLDGFDEFIVRCGLESNGAPEFDDAGRLRYPLHGRIANRPADDVEVSVDAATGEIALTGVVEETRFLFRRLRMTSTLRTRPGEAGFTLHDEVENLAAVPCHVQMLYHVNLGPPLLGAGARFVAPVVTVVPRNDRAAEGIASWDRCEGEDAGFQEQVYFMELAADRNGNTQAMLRNAEGSLGLSLHFHKEQLPCFSLWKNTRPAADGYVTGIEPGTNFPNPRSYERRHERDVPLAAGGKFSFDLRVEVHDSPAAVKAAEREITALGAGVKPRICDRPQRGWCADVGE